jgi:hypothetical protein
VAKIIQPYHETRSATDIDGLKFPDLPLAGQPLPHLSFPIGPLPHPPLNYTDFSGLIHRRARPYQAAPADIEIYERVITPYDSSAFARLLDKHNLSAAYSLLVTNLDNGFPLGDLPVLSTTVIIKNHPSVDKNIGVVQDYIDTELAAHRMSGPFTQAAAERILRGPFYCSPFIVAEQDQGPLLPPKFRVCRNLSKGDSKAGVGSVNSFISKDDFPTRFDMAHRVADAVSSVLDLWHRRSSAGAPNVDAAVRTFVL